MKKFILTSLMIVLFSTMAISQSLTYEPIESYTASQTFKHSINFCPGGIAFGVYAMNFEYLFKPHHGMVVRFDYEAVPKSYTEANIESSGVAFILNYRYHFSGELGSTFIGLYSRYKIYNGYGRLEAEDFDFTQDFDFNLKHFTLGINAGKRWVWNSGFNITFQLGYGLDTDNRTATPSNADIESTLDLFENDYAFIDPFFGELSIGWAF